MSAPVMAVIEIGVFCRAVSRFVAVTMISSRIPRCASAEPETVTHRTVANARMVLLTRCKPHDINVFLLVTTDVVIVFS